MTGEALPCRDPALFSLCCGPADRGAFVCSNAVAGESALDRIACGLGGKIILPIIKQHIMQMLQNCEETPLGVGCLNPNGGGGVLTCLPVCAADWKYRHAGLMALSAIGEGCHQQMEAILQEIVSYVLLFCSDFVRGGACSSGVWLAGGVSKFLLLRSIRGCATPPATPLDRWPQTSLQRFRRSSTIRWVLRLPEAGPDQAGNVKELLWFFLQVIAALLQTMEDQNFPRVQAHAAAALINFTEDCPKSILIPYLDNLLQHLHVIMVGKLNEVKARFPGFDASARSSAPSWDIFSSS